MLANGGAPDQTCVQQLLRPDFVGSASLNKALFGTSDVYDGEAFPPAAVTSNTDVSRTTFLATVVPLAVVAVVCSVALVWQCSQQRRARGPPLAEAGKSNEYVLP